MAFPATPAPLKGELYINGAWVDVTTDIRGGGNEVRIERGRRDVQGAAQPTSAIFTLDNRSGTYTDDNPMSPYYNLLPLFTPCRISLTGSATDSYMHVTGIVTDGYASTADKAALDITGDIDVRAEIDPNSWGVPGNASADSFIIAGKSGVTYSTDFSWFVGIAAGGYPYMIHSPDGTITNSITTRSTVALPTTSDRLAVRFVLDVDTGAGSRGYSFYYSTSIDAAWTLLTSDYYAGTTSIFGGAGALELGSIGGGEHVFNTVYTFGGKMYAVQVRNSAGTLVANADFRSLAVGTTSFSDGLGNTWNVNGNAFVTSDSIRFWGEVENLPQEWDVTGRENVTRASAYDQLKRFGADQTPILSPLYRVFTGYNPSLYLPGEDGANATLLSSAADGAEAAQTENARFQADDTLPGSDGSWQLTGADTYVRALAREGDPVSDVSTAVWFCKMPTLGAGDVLQMYLYNSTGRIRRWYIFVSSAGITVQGLRPSGDVEENSSTVWSTVDPSAWVGFSFEVRQTAPLVYRWRISWYEVSDNPTVYYIENSWVGTSGQIDAMIIDSGASFSDAYYAHMGVTNDATFNVLDMLNAANGHIGETAGLRFQRLCQENGASYEMDGWAHLTATMGRQRVASLLENLQECADADGGLLLGSRRRLGLQLITREFIARKYNSVSLSHSGHELASTPRPQGDSFGRRNDVTVTRANGGGSARRVVTDGRFGTDRIGTVPGGASVNVEADSDLADVAATLAALGTWDEKRIENIHVALHRAETLLSSTKGKALLTTDVGRYLTLSGFPSHQAPGSFEQLIQGYVEVISNKLYDIAFNGSPYGPWRHSIMDGPAGAIRFAATDTTVGTAMNTTTTTLMLDTSGSDPLWATTALVPTMTFNFNIKVAGEEMTVTNIVGGASPQTATVTRSVNGVVKSHSVGELVQLSSVSYFGR